MKRSFRQTLRVRVVVAVGCFQQVLFAQFLLAILKGFAVRMWRARTGCESGLGCEDKKVLNGR